MSHRKTPRAVDHSGVRLRIIRRHDEKLALRLQGLDTEGGTGHREAGEEEEEEEEALGLLVPLDVAIPQSHWRIARVPRTASHIFTAAAPARGKVRNW